MKKLKQISMKELGYSAKEIRNLVEDKGEAVFLARIGGVAVETFKGEGIHGEWNGFKGEFIAANQKGEKFASSVAFFPANIANQLLDQFEHGVVEVEVKADVYAIESDKNASGYGYMCEPVIDAKTKSRVEQMQGSLFKDLPLAIEDKTQMPAKGKKEKAA